MPYQMTTPLFFGIVLLIVCATADFLMTLRLASLARKKGRESTEIGILASLVMKLTGWKLERVVGAQIFFFEIPAAILLTGYAGGSPREAMAQGACLALGIAVGAHITAVLLMRHQAKQLK